MLMRKCADHIAIESTHFQIFKSSNFQIISTSNTLAHLPIAIGTHQHIKKPLNFEKERLYEQVLGLNIIFN